MPAVIADIHGGMAAASLFSSLAGIAAERYTLPVQPGQEMVVDTGGRLNAAARWQGRQYRLFATRIQIDTVACQMCSHKGEDPYFFFQRGIDKPEAGPFCRSAIDFFIIVAEAGNTAPDTVPGGHIGDTFEIGQVVPVAGWGFVETDRVKTPGDGLGTVNGTQRFQLAKPIVKRRYVRFQRAGFGIDRKVEEKPVAIPPEPFTIPFIDEGAEVFGPEDDRMDMPRRKRDGSGPQVIRVDRFDGRLFDLLHEPRHIKTRNIGPARGGDDHLPMRHHPSFFKSAREITLPPLDEPVSGFRVSGFDIGGTG